MDLLLGEASQLARPCVDLLDVLYREINVIDVGPRLNAAGGRVEYRQDDGATIEVSARTPERPSLGIKQPGIEVDGLVQVGYLQHHTEQFGNISHRSSPSLDRIVMLISTTV